MVSAASGEALWPALVEGKFGYVDETGRVIIPPQFEQVRNFSEGLACVQVQGRWGYIDPTGAFVIPPQFEWAEDFSSGTARVGTNPFEAHLIDAGTPPAQALGSR